MERKDTDNSAIQRRDEEIRSCSSSDKTLCNKKWEKIFIFPSSSEKLFAAWLCVHFWEIVHDDADRIKSSTFLYAIKNLQCTRCLSRSVGCFGKSGRMKPQTSHASSILYLSMFFNLNISPRRVHFDGDIKINRLCTSIASFCVCQSNHQKSSLDTKNFFLAASMSLRWHRRSTDRTTTTTMQDLRSYRT